MAFDLKMDSEEGYASKVLNRLNDQRNDIKYCDVRLKVSGRHLAAHSCVLAACSPFFQSVFERRNQISVSLTSGILELDVPGMLGPLVGLERGGLEAVQGLLTYIYTGEIDLNTTNAQLVIQLADVVMLDGLSALARNFLQSTILPCTLNTEGDISQQPQEIFVRHSPVGAAHEPETPKTTVDSQKISSDTRKKQCHSVHKRRSREKFVLKNIAQLRTLAVSHKNSRGSDADLENSEASFGLAGHERTFKCQQCPFASNNTREIREHRSIHCGKAYVCNCCGFIAFQAHQLLDHMLEEKHPEKVCSLCGFKAQTIASFEEHLHKHNDRKPFFCASCSLRFRTRTALSKHTTALKQTAGTSCCRASKCKPQHGETRQSSLGAVLRLNPATQANHASRTTEPQDCKKHMFSRVKLKPYQCEFCGQKFSHEKHKQIHARMHHFGRNLMEPSTQL